MSNYRAKLRRLTDTRAWGVVRTVVVLPSIVVK